MLKSFIFLFLLFYFILFSCFIWKNNFYLPRRNWVLTLDKDVLSLDDIIVDGECQRSTELNKESSDTADGCCPTIGMCFESPNEAKTFYLQYAITKGFGIRTRSLKKGSDNELR